MCFLIIILYLTFGGALGYYIGEERNFDDEGLLQLFSIGMAFFWPLILLSHFMYRLIRLLHNTVNKGGPKS